MRKTREIIGSILKKQMFIITKSVVGVADVYFDSQVFIIDLHQPSTSMSRTPHVLSGHY